MRTQRAPLGSLSPLPNRLWGGGLLAFVVFAFVALLYGPDLVLQLSGDDVSELTPAERVAATTAMRQVILFSLGGLLAVFTLFLAQGRDAVARAKHDIDRDAHWTSRYNDAVTQLGSTDQLAVRLGGIYALQRLAAEASALDERDDTAAIRDLLAAFIRTSSRADHKEGDRAPEDILAAARVLGRTESFGQQPLNLAEAWLTDADLRRADLTDANLLGAELQRAELHGATLTGASLSGAKMHNVLCPGANFDGAYLNGVDARASDFTKANLREALLAHADLKTANLSGANLHEAQCFKTDFAYAHFDGADLTRVKMAQSNLAAATFKGAVLHGAQLGRALNATNTQFDSASVDAGTQLPRRLVDYDADEEGGEES